MRTHQAASQIWGSNDVRVDENIYKIVVGHRIIRFLLHSHNYSLKYYLSLLLLSLFHFSYYSLTLIKRYL